MSIDFSLLQALGWRNEFSQQLTLDQLETLRPARVIGVARDRFRVDDGIETMPASLAGRYRHQHTAAMDYPTVGDWVLLEDGQAIVERLERHSLIARRMAGGSEPQAIAANIDVLLIVSGLDAEFNLHRIERYLIVATQAGVTPVVVLTKADLCADPAPSLASVRERLPANGHALAVDGHNDSLSARLAPWLAPGNTLVVVGSSGVGKSTVINNLLGQEQQKTQATGDDAKGRHTTTARSLLRLASGACIIDVPGMREVGLAPTEGGVRAHFRSLEELARDCRFGDCRHEQEPGCAVRVAVERGEVNEDEWQHYLKLLAEEKRNVAAYERHQQERVFGRMVRSALAMKRKHGRR